MMVKNMNNKGFAISTILYGILLIGIMVINLLFSTLAFSKKQNNDYVKAVTDQLNAFATSSLEAYTSATKEINTSDSITYIVDYNGYYKINACGAKGTGTNGGKGSCVSGIINLVKGTSLYLTVGSNGEASDVRTKDTTDSYSLESRIMVAAGGGSASSSGAKGGDGGDLLGKSSTTGVTDFVPMQELSYTDSTYTTTTTFGVGQTGVGGKGGDGYYGGIAGSTTSIGGTGGSSYISGYAGVNSVVYDDGSLTYNPTNKTINNNDYYFINGVINAGTHDSTTGYLKIQYYSVDAPLKKSDNKIDHVKYIKDCIGSNNIDSKKRWTEIQAIKDGVNVAKYKQVTPNNFTFDTTEKSEKVVDGSIAKINVDADTGNIVDKDEVVTSLTGDRCITVALDNSYDLDEIAVWHSFQNNITKYDNHTLSVSNDNITWTALINKQTSKEITNGIRYSAYNN